MVDHVSYQTGNAALKDGDATLPVNLLMLDFKSQRSRREYANVAETFSAECVALVRHAPGTGTRAGARWRPTMPVSPRWSCTVRSLPTCWAKMTAISPRWVSG